MLDIVADRYSRLGRADAALVRPRLELGHIEMGKAVRLSNGIDLAGRKLVEAAALRPTASALDTPHCAERRGEALVALVAWRGLLKRLGLARTLDWAERGRRVGGRCADVFRLAHGFEAARAFAPFKRRCLPDSLALHWIARRHGLATTLILGVRDQPFVAHAWVQLDDLVLDDPVETVREFTPILAR